MKEAEEQPATDPLNGAHCATRTALCRAGRTAEGLAHSQTTPALLTRVRREKCRPRCASQQARLQPAYTLRRGRRARFECNHKG